MDSDAFFDLIVSNRKESDILRKEKPLALKECIDPAKFVMDTFGGVFPVDRGAVKSASGDLGWVCVLLLEGLVSALAEPKLEAKKSFVTRIVKERAEEMAKAVGAEKELKVRIHEYRRLRFSEKMTLVESVWAMPLSSSSSISTGAVRAVSTPNTSVVK